jgi:hypothetical protein
LAVTVFRLGKGNNQIVGNMQLRKQTQAAAQQAIEEVISSTQFTQTPTNAVANPCNSNANTTCMSVNGSGNNDVTVAVTPTCVSTRIIPNNDPSLWNDANGQGCTQGTTQNFGTSGADTGNSLCANTLWDVQATATDSVSNSQSTLHEGAAVRVPATTQCP